jgi:Holliday junction resolvase RusA-like endonuclease
LDSLNTLAFKDDNQVTKIDIEKLYSENERVYVKIEEY